MITHFPKGNLKHKEGGEEEEEGRRDEGGGEQRWRKRGREMGRRGGEVKEEGRRGRKEEGDKGEEIKIHDNKNKLISH